MKEVGGGRREERGERREERGERRGGRREERGGREDYLNLKVLPGFLPYLGVHQYFFQSKLEEAEH